MSFTLVLGRTVRNELATERTWYERQSYGLGDKLAHEFYAALEHVQNAPHAQIRVSDKFRKRHLARFPYSLYFRVRESQIMVTALIHRKRSDPFIAQRLRSES